MPVNLMIGFGLSLMGDRTLFSGKPPTQPRPFEYDEDNLFARPYNEWAPPPFNDCPIRSASAMNLIMVAVSGMTDLLALVTSTSTECDRDLHHIKTRLLHGLPPMSPARWRMKGLHEPTNVQRACQHLCTVVDAFEYLNLPHTQSRMRKACNGTWKECDKFSRALSAYRQQRGRGPVSVTAAWEEYMVDYLETIAARAHAWVIGRVDELLEALLLQLRSTTGGANGQTSPGQIIDSIHELNIIMTEADARIMLPLFRYTLKTLTSAAPRLRDDWGGYRGAEPMTEYPYDMLTRVQVYSMRLKFLNKAAGTRMIIDGQRNGIPFSYTQDPERCSRLMFRELARARRELRGPAPETGDEPWITSLKNTLRMSIRPRVRVWGFVGYRVSYAHSDEEWKEFLRRVEDDVMAWGQGVDGAADVKPTCRLMWIDGREHGIPEDDIEAARRHYKTYSKSPACEDLLTARQVFLAADEASVDSYLEPVQGTTEPVIPRGDLGSFLLAVQPASARETGNGRRGRRGRGAGASGDEFDGTLRVLGSILFDDLWAAIFDGAFNLEDLSKMAEIHPRHVYAGPSVPMERQGWRDAGCWSLTAFKSFEKWQAL
ncbi:uncharacterized protein LY79DRAFT_559652 [Colletotrichum navitas]|uniref:Uncharacterized protein n=1 Tax=Colletotrichum navitas TaxID=681940 RepID=A0AAD8PV55_9PEZI|nr:uncharacterized protein LY79DRAFT_559652 [Colletotrichum navitas]KAK1585072.1 hypothetical protein LY79DRAFT_559652 [Colletotrichum navitas]